MTKPREQPQGLEYVRRTKKTVYKELSEIFDRGHTALVILEGVFLLGEH